MKDIKKKRSMYYEITLCKIRTKLIVFWWDNIIKITKFLLPFRLITEKMSL